MQMAYLGDIRENSISPEGNIWENDNRKETRYYWNGALIDLCDLPPEDYAKTIFVTNVSGGTVTPSKTVNVITVNEMVAVNGNGEQLYAYQAVSKQPVTSNITIQIIVKADDGNEEEIMILIATGYSMSDIVPTKILVDSTETVRIITSNYNPKEDDNFKYNVVLPEEKPVYPMAYNITLKKGEVDTISNDDLIKLILDSGEISMKDEVTSEKFVVNFEPIAVDGLTAMKEAMNYSGIKQALLDYSQDIIIVTDKDVKRIEQAGFDGNEIELWTKRNKSVNVNGTEYFVWYKRDENSTSQSVIYDSVTNEKFGVETNVEYIIYYN